MSFEHENEHGKWTVISFGLPYQLYPEALLRDIADKVKGCFEIQHFVQDKATSVIVVGHEILMLPTWVLEDIVDIVQYQQENGGFEEYYEFRKEHYVEEMKIAGVVPDNIPDDVDSIARWANRQKQIYRQGKMTSEQYDALNAVPGWDWDMPIKILPKKELE